MVKYLLISSLIFFLAQILACDASSFTVGDSAGWDVSADLQSWPTDKTFNVGDVLLFQYSRYQNLNEVDKASYDSCNTSNAILSSSNGNTTVTLATAGKNYYFISGRPLNCFGGMKLHVKVVGGDKFATSPDSSPKVSGSTGDNNDILPGLTNGSFNLGNRAIGVEALLCIIGVFLWVAGFGL